MILILVEYSFLKKICSTLDMIMMIVMKQCIIWGDIDRIESDRNDIINLINNDGYKHDVTLLVEDSKIFICKNLWCCCIKNYFTNYWTMNYHIH